MNNNRAVLNVLFFGSILFLPWWVSLPLGLLLLFFFGAFEVILGGFLHDSLYAAPREFFWGAEFLGVGVALFFYLIFLVLKKYFIFHREPDV